MIGMWHSLVGVMGRGQGRGKKHPISNGVLTTLFRHVINFNAWVNVV